MAGRLGALDQFLCDAVREKCFAKTGIAIEKEIFKRMVKIPDEIKACFQGVLRRLSCSQAGERVRHKIRVIIKRKSRKVLGF